MKQLLQQCVGFEWNKGTAEKNWVLHRVNRTECEQSFFNEPLTMTYKKTVPVFKNEDEEREFWAKEDTSDYVDWSKAKKVTFSNLKPSTKTISLRLPEFLLDELKLLAHKRDVPYQSLIKMFLKDRVNQEFRQSV